MTPSTPLARTLVLNTKGVDVIAVKRALSRAGYMKWGDFTDVYGDNARNAVHAFQAKVGLKFAGYGLRTHDALLRTHATGAQNVWAWTQYEINLMHQEYVLLHENPETAIRNKIIQAARWLYGYRSLIRYSQSRPFHLVHIGGSVPSSYDCSGFVTDCHYAGGAVNPNMAWDGTRLAYNGEGYTGTLIQGGHKVRKDELKPGDLVFYGYSRYSSPAFPIGSPTHVALWEGGDMIFSMGSYPMSHTHYTYRSDLNCFVHYNVLGK